jgi:cytochrome c biogenesis protein CcdA
MHAAGYLLPFLIIGFLVSMGIEKSRGWPRSGVMFWQRSGKFWVTVVVVAFLLLALVANWNSTGVK